MPGIEIEPDVLSKHCKGDELSLCYSVTVSISKMSVCLLMEEFWTVDISTKTVTNSIHLTTTMYRIGIPLLSYTM